MVKDISLDKNLEEAEIHPEDAENLEDYMKRDPSRPSVIYRGFVMPQNLNLVQTPNQSIDFTKFVPSNIPQNPRDKKDILMWAEWNIIYSRYDLFNNRGD